MDDDLQKMMGEFDYTFPPTVIGEMFLRLLKVESRVEAVYALFAHVASRALQEDEEAWERQLDEIERELFNEKMASFIARFGQIPGDSKPSEGVE
jgi:hypothetical protein